jgi:hypothetical protein
MTDRDNVIPIGRAALSRARVVSSDKAEDGFAELAREVVGTHTFVAERGRVRGKNVWRIRIEGTDEVIDYFEPAIHRETFAALVGTEPEALDDWLSGRAFVRKPTT